MTDLNKAPGARIDRIEGKNSGNPKQAEKTMMITAFVALAVFAVVNAFGHSEHAQLQTATCVAALQEGW